MSNALKEKIKKYALSLGVDDVGIGAVADYKSKLSPKIETIFLPGLINIDFADLKTILQGQGRFAYFNRVEVQGANRAVEAIKKALNCPLYPYTIRGAKRVLFNITGEKELSLSDVSQVSKTIFELVNPEAKIIFGVSQDKKYKDKIKVALLATGCGVKALLEKTEDLQKTGRRQKKKAGKKVVIKTKKRRTKRRKKSKPKAKPKSKPKAKAKPKKVRIKIRVKKKEPVIAEEPEQIPEEIVPVQSVAFFEGGTKARKNAVQLKKESEEAEKEFLEKERTWELPAFLRKGQNK